MRSILNVSLRALPSLVALSPARQITQARPRTSCHRFLLNLVPVARPELGLIYSLNPTLPPQEGRNVLMGSSQAEGGPAMVLCCRGRL